MGTRARLTSWGSGGAKLNHFTLESEAQKEVEELNLEYEYALRLIGMQFKHMPHADGHYFIDLMPDVANGHTMLGCVALVVDNKGKAEVRILAGEAYPYSDMLFRVSRLHEIPMVEYAGFEPEADEEAYAPDPEDDEEEYIEPDDDDDEAEYLSDSEKEERAKAAQMREEQKKAEDKFKVDLGGWE